MYRDLPEGYSKDLWRVYERMVIMLGREGGAGRVPARAFARIVAWHHLRFAVAFALAADRPAARRVLDGLRADGLMPAAPAAAVRYLLPFLGRRAARRLRRGLGR